MLVLIFLSACFSQLVVSSCGGMMGAIKLERSRRVASSFYQAGSMAFGAAVGVGLDRRQFTCQPDDGGVDGGSVDRRARTICAGSAGQELIADSTFGEDDAAGLGGVQSRRSAVGCGAVHGVHGVSDGERRGG